MKNKEIEELLNDMRHSYKIHEEIIKKYNNADKISYPYRISLKQINLLLSYIEQLENNRDKAIEYLKEKADYPISYYHCIREAIDILKGDSDD